MNFLKLISVKNGKQSFVQVSPSTIDNQGDHAYCKGMCPPRGFAARYHEKNWIKDELALVTHGGSGETTVPAHQHLPWSFMLSS